MALSLDLKLGLHGMGASLPSGYIAKWRDGVESVGPDSKMLDLSGNGNDLTVVGYCPTFDGSEGQYLSGPQILGNEGVTAHGGTAETLTVAAGKITPSSGTVEWIQLDDGRKYIIQSSKTAAQTNFYNINGNLVDFLTTVGLTAPYCTAKASSASLINGFDLKENLIGVLSSPLDSEPNTSARMHSVGDVTVRAGSGLFASFAGEIVYGDNSVTRYSRLGATNDNNTVYFSFYIAMDDGGVPIAGASNNASADFIACIRSDLQTQAGTITPVDGMPGVYKCLFSKVGSGSGVLFGVYKLTTNSARSFKITRLHVFVNPKSKYLKSYYTASVALYNPCVRETFFPKIKSYNTTAKIICIGDSMTAGDYPVHLPVIFPNATIIDAGHAGDGVSNMLARFQVDVLDKNPDYIIYFGVVNSIIGDISAVAIMADINAMVNMALSAGKPMVVGTGIPFGLHTGVGWTEARQAVMDSVNASILAMTQSNIIAKVDLFTPFLAVGSLVNQIVSTGTTDGLHMGNNGNRKLTALLVSALGIASSTSNDSDTILNTDNQELFALNAPAALEAADVDNRWFTDSVANDVDPATIPANAGDKIFKGPSAMVMYSTPLIGNAITKAEKYVD